MISILIKTSKVVIIQRERCIHKYLYICRPDLLDNFIQSKSEVEYKRFRKKEIMTRVILTHFSMLQ